MTPEDPTVHDLGRLLAVLQGLDLTSADGRAGIGGLLSEIERLSRFRPATGGPDRAAGAGVGQAVGRLCRVVLSV